MRYRPLLFALVLPLALNSVACRSHRKLAHQFKDFERGYQDCQPGKENCTFLRLSYPNFRRAPTPEGLNAINQGIMDFILAPTGEGKASDVESFARQFFADYKNFRQQFPQAPQVWTLQRSVDIMIENPQLLSLSMKEESYLGGAHPNTNRVLASLNPATGKRYALGELLNPGFEQPLTDLAEKKFREVRQIPSGQSLEDAGFNFEGGAFKLNDNFAAADNGLVFYYNAYEVGPYAAGPTEVVVDYASFQDWIKKDGPLHELTR